MKHKTTKGKKNKNFTLLHETIYMMGTKTISAFFFTFPYAYCCIYSVLYCVLYLMYTFGLRLYFMLTSSFSTFFFSFNSILISFQSILISFVHYALFKFVVENVFRLLAFFIRSQSIRGKRYNKLA